MMEEEIEDWETQDVLLEKKEDFEAINLKNEDTEKVIQEDEDKISGQTYINKIFNDRLLLYNCTQKKLSSARQKNKDTYKIKVHVRQIIIDFKSLNNISKRNIIQDVLDGKAILAKGAGIIWKKDTKRYNSNDPELRNALNYDIISMDAEAKKRNNFGVRLDDDYIIDTKSQMKNKKF
jgi:hypothetical protein